MIEQYRRMIVIGSFLLVALVAYFFPFEQYSYIITIVGSIIASLGVYFFPTLIGLRKKNALAIFILNIFLRWTLIGWVVALVWAVTVDD